jgi:hypothetical protein
MVSRASAVGCHPLREVPSLKGRRSISLKRQVLQTRRPTGLDCATLTGVRTAVKAAGAHTRPEENLLNVGSVRLVRCVGVCPG